MKFKVETDWLRPIKIGKFEWVDVVRTDGSHVTVFDDKIYVATAEERFDHKDGRRVDG